MKYVIYFPKNVEKTFEKLLNLSFKKKYDWFKKIEIEKVSFETQKKYLGITGKIFIDSDWVGNQWREYNYSLPFPDSEELTFGDIIGGQQSKNIQEDIFNIFTIITSEIPKYTSFSWLQVIMVDDDKQINEEKEDKVEYAVIEITKPLSRMEPKYYFQEVPYWKTKEDIIYIKKGSSGYKTISTKNIKVLKVFKNGNTEELQAYLQKLRENNSIIKESNINKVQKKEEEFIEKLVLTEMKNYFLPKNFYGIACDIYPTKYGLVLHITKLMKEMFNSIDLSMITTDDNLKKTIKILFGDRYSGGITISTSTIEKYKEDKKWYDEQKTKTF